MQRGDEAARTILGTAAALGRRCRTSNALPVAVLIVLPMAWFNRVIWPSLTGKTLVPFENLYALEPWRSQRPDVVPHNQLVSDLVLQSAVWQLHIRRALGAGELPLWNPDVFGGAPFLANAQSSVLYPLSAIFYGLPVPDALGWYTTLHVSLAGVCMYVLGRALGLQPYAALLAGLAYMFSGYFITNATFPQVVGAAAWLPLLLGCVHALTRDAELTWPWVVGSVVLGVQFLAGHPETSLYGLVVIGAYAVVRIATTPERREVGAATGKMLGMLVLGSALAAVQLLPTWEAVGNNARQGASTAAELAEVAWPPHQLWTLLLPDLFGNPTHRQWFDIWSATWRDSPTIVWGTKNYVEGGVYLGITTLLLAGVGLLRGARKPALFFGALGVLAVFFMVGSPVYLLLDVVPGVEQLRSPFRWVFPFTVAICILAGLGLDAVLTHRVGTRVVGGAAVAAGVLVLGLVGTSLVVREPFFKLAQRFVTDPAWAERAFGRAGQLLPNALSTPEMFWGYESQGLLRLGLAALASGLLLLLIVQRRGIATTGLLGLLVIDLYSVHGAFLPSVSVDLAPTTAPKPAVIDAVERHVAATDTGQPWRFTTLERGDEKTLLANAGMFYGWQDVRGYDSIISRDYATFTQRRGLAADSLAFNRIPPIYSSDVLDGELVRLMNVTYVLSEQRIANTAYHEIYRDEHIGAYWNSLAWPRTWVESRGVSRVAAYGVNHVDVEASLDEPGWVVLADNDAPGWRASARHRDGFEQQLDVYRAHETLRAVHLPAAGEWTIRFRYWPDSFAVGLGISSIAAATLLAMAIRSRKSATTSRVGACIDPSVESA